MFVLCSRFLHEVQSHSAINKMISSNLGTVFGPNLLRPDVSLCIFIPGKCAYIYPLHECVYMQLCMHTCMYDSWKSKNISQYTDDCAKTVCIILLHDS